MTHQDKQEHCGIFGVFNHQDAVKKTYFGLHALQHRGEEGAGIASTDGSRILQHKDLGLVSDVFSQTHMEELQNKAAIGHVRYSTTGASNTLNTQPIVVESGRGKFALAHNGNLVNSASLREQCEQRGAIFQTSMDSEIILHLLANPELISQKNPEPQEDHSKATTDSSRNNEQKELSFYQACCKKLKGAYSLLVLRPGELTAIRDPQGFRPLSLGKLDGNWIVSSETCAFDILEANYVRDVKPGEIVRITEEGLSSSFIPGAKESSPASCVFEYVYFSRPDSNVFGKSVQKVRERSGMQLAKESDVPADCVISIPDSGNAAALGYAKETGLPLEHGFIRNHYIGRSFIQPTQDQRKRAVRMKLNLVKETIQDQRLVVVDDSIIRGTTSKSRIKLLKEAGAEEVHLRIACPPIISPCYYGIDFPSEEELIANNKSIDEICDHVGADSLAYLSLDGLLEATGKPKNSFCTACWDKDYPLNPPEDFHKLVLEDES